jgi:hypothetical protein
VRNGNCWLRAALAQAARRSKTYLAAHPVSPADEERKKQALRWRTPSGASTTYSSINEDPGEMRFDNRQKAHAVSSNVYA